MYVCIYIYIYINNLLNKTNQIITYKLIMRGALSRGHLKIPMSLARSRRRARGQRMAHTGMVRYVLLVQGPCYSSLYRSNFNG